MSNTTPLYYVKPLKKREYKVKEKSLLVLSRSEARTYYSPGSHAIISIQDPGDDPVEFASDLKCEHILRLHFIDLEKTNEKHITFNEFHANQILKFLKDTINKVDNIVVHCEMGICRSPAVAAFIAEYLGGDSSFYFDNYFPNKLVINTLRKKFVEDSNE